MLKWVHIKVFVPFIITGQYLTHGARRRRPHSGHLRLVAPAVFAFPHRLARLVRRSLRPLDRVSADQSWFRLLLGVTCGTDTLCSAGQLLIKNWLTRPVFNTRPGVGFKMANGGLWLTAEMSHVVQVMNIFERSQAVQGMFVFTDWVILVSEF